MTPRALIRGTAASFREAGVPDPLLDASLLLSHVTGRSAMELRLDDETELDGSTLDAFHALAERRITREPLQYLTGEAYFLGRVFHVDDRVLIPRPETELLAEMAIAELRKHGEGAAALDLCCGSGCIGISMALGVKNAVVHLSDLSKDALAVTELNAGSLGARVKLFNGDMFAPIRGMRYHVIVSNPPYIPAEDCRHLQDEVLKEPMTALDGGADGLDFYRVIARQAPDMLYPGGALFLEVGWDQAEPVCALLQDAGMTDVISHQDYNGISRMVEARRPV